MEDQLSIRLPRDLSRRLTQRARAAGVKRSQVVRDALTAFFGTPNAAADVAAAPARSVKERIGPYLGSLKLDHAGAERDALAKRIRAHNWRE